jgi:hypothetical protein
VVKILEGLELEWSKLRADLQHLDERAMEWGRAEKDRIHALIAKQLGRSPTTSVPSKPDKK